MPEFGPLCTTPADQRASGNFAHIRVMGLGLSCLVCLPSPSSSPGSLKNLPGSWLGWLGPGCGAGGVEHRGAVLADNSRRREAPLEVCAQEMCSPVAPFISSERCPAMADAGWGYELCFPWDLAWMACCIGLDIPESVHDGTCGWLAAQSDIEP